MIVLRMAGKILLLPVWLLLATAHLLVKIAVEIYCIGKGIVKKAGDGIKILGNGELTKNLTVQVAAFSESAKQKIEAAGGKAEVM